jgi:hypothetical protein
MQEIERHSVADQSYLREDVRLLELAKNARQLFDQQEPREQRRLLNFVVSNCSWKDGHLTVRYRQPFDLLVDTAENAQGLAAAEGPEIAKTEIWLPFLDTYRMLCLAPAPPLKLLLEQVKTLASMA